MKKYTKLLLKYGLIFHIYLHIEAFIFSLLAGLILTPVAFLLPIEDTTTIGGIIGTSIFLIVGIGIFYYVFYKLSKKTFKLNLKKELFSEKTIKEDILYSTLFFSIFPILTNSLIAYFLWINVWVVINPIIYIISFYVINFVVMKKFLKWKNEKK